MTNRFFQPPTPSPIDKLLDSASNLDLKMFRNREGKVVVNFELSGFIGSYDDDDEIEVSADMKLVRDLIAKFGEGGRGDGQ